MYDSKVRWQRKCVNVLLMKIVVGKCQAFPQSFKAEQHRIGFLWFSQHFRITVKGEVWNWFNLISEERVQNFEQNSENLMKIGWKIRKLWHFEISQIFKKHFVTSQYEYANEWVDDVITSQFPIHFLYTEMKKNSYFSYENVRLALITLWIDAEY